MQTYAIVDPETSRTFAFEIENLGNTPAWCARVLREISGVTDVRTLSPFDRFQTDVRVTYKYLGQPFEVMEPFGDSILDRSGRSGPGTAGDFTDRRGVQTLGVACRDSVCRSLHAAGAPPPTAKTAAV